MRLFQIKHVWKGRSGNARSRQRVVLSPGDVKVPKSFWAELAEMIERRLVGQESLLPETSQLQEIAERAVERIDVGEEFDQKLKMQKTPQYEYNNPCHFLRLPVIA